MDAETNIGVHVGGQLFETTVAVLTRDPYSILAAACRKNSPINKCKDDHYAVYFDRDWWLFRHVLAFLEFNQVLLLYSIIVQLF